MALATASAPTAHASSRKSIYDDDDDESIAPVPGTSEPVTTPTPAAAAAATPSKTELTKTELVNGVTIRSTDTLEKYVAAGRTWLAEHVASAETSLNAYFDKYLSAEKTVSTTVADLKSADEDILPGAIYILVAALSGSVVARNRNVLVRAAAPLVFGTAAFAYFLPEAYANTGKLVWKFEQRAPALAQAHIDTEKSVKDFAASVDTAVKDANSALESSVHTARKFVADTTGLQIPDEKNKK